MTIETEQIKQDYTDRDDKPDAWAKGKIFEKEMRSFLHEKEDCLLELLGAEIEGNMLPYLSILDIGCGDGNILLDFIRYGATPTECYGIDLMENRVKLAKDNIPQGKFDIGNASELPYGSDEFDLVLLFTVLSSTNKEMQKDICKEAVRVLNERGCIVVFDNLNVGELFPKCKIKSKTIKSYHKQDVFISVITKES